MGCPKQEKWIYMNYRKLGVPVSIGIGASLDFVAGKFRRAPVWARLSGLEWLFRLMQEPGRLFNRYLIDLIFFVRELRRQRRLLSSADADANAAIAKQNKSAFSGDYLQCQWSGRIDAVAVRQKTVEAFSPEPMLPNVVLDCSQVTFIDSTGLGLLIATFRRCKEVGGTFLLASPSPVVVQILSALRLDRLIPTAKTPEEIRERLNASAPGAVDFSFVHSGSKSLTVSLSGDITAGTVAECERTIAVRWNAMPESLVLNLDLQRVSFMDSSGLGLLIKTLKLVKQRPGATLQLVELRPNVRNVIHLANMETVLGLAPEAK